MHRITTDYILPAVLGGGMYGLFIYLACLKFFEGAIL